MSLPVGAPTAPLHVPAEHEMSCDGPGVPPAGVTTTATDCVPADTYPGRRAPFGATRGTAILTDSVAVPAPLSFVPRPGAASAGGLGPCATPPPAHAESNAQNRSRVI